MRRRYGHCEFIVLPFGLINAHATFMGLINLVLRPYLDQFVVLFMDDILIFSKFIEQHRLHVRKVSEVLRKSGCVAS